MTQHSFPWNDVNGDRLYDASDFMRFFAAFLKTGVVMSFKDGLRVRSAQNGMNIQVGAGSAVIDGGSYMNNETIAIQINVASSAQDRTDSVVLRMDKNARDTYLYYKPSDTTVVRNDIIFELQLAKISVKMNAAQITDADITDMRSDPTVCGWSTPFDNINVDGIVDQYKEIFEQADVDFQAWFQNLKDQLDDNQAANLQNQIDAINNAMAQKAIPEGANLDDYKVEGEFSKGNTITVTGAPKDVSGAFRLSVRTMLGSTAFFQRLYDYGTASTYIRFANYNGWKSWQKLITADETGTVKVQDIEISGSVTRPSKSILWAGAFYMSDLHKISPAKPLSECENGWILHFTEYTAGMNGNTKNAFNHYINVPKEHLDLAQAGTVFPLMSPGSTPTAAVKYLYIRDGEVAGHSMNRQGNNMKFVLQHVLEY